MTDHRGMTMKERVARAINEGLGESWAYCNYSGNEWVQCRDMLDSAAELAIAAMSSPSHDRAMAEGGWQDIASAPKDGRSLILLCVDKETFSLEEEGTLWREGDLSVLFGKWDAPISREEFEQNIRWEIEGYGRILDPGIQTYEDYAETVLGGWHIPANDGIGRELDVTHWQPLPAPPTPTTKEETA